MHPVKMQYEILPNVQAILAIPKRKKKQKISTISQVYGPKRRRYSKYQILRSKRPKTLSTGGQIPADRFSHVFAAA